MAFSNAYAEKSPEKSPEKTEVRGYISVQLQSFSIPTVGADGGIGHGPMTIFLVVRGQQNVESLCQYLPRVREAITITVDQSPVPVMGKKYKLQEIGERLLQRINRALPKPIVFRLHMFPLARKMGKGADILDLPGTNERCMSIREMPKDTIAMLRGEKPIGKTFTVSDPEAPPKLIAKTWVPKQKQSKARTNEPAKAVTKTVPQVSENTKIEFKDCKKIDKIWTEGFHNISGAKYWVDRIYALDENGDGTVDNIGFNLKAENKSEFFIYYFPGKTDRPSVAMVPTLRLKDDRVVPKICFGQASYFKPKPNEMKPAPGFQAPDLAAELKAKVEGKNKVGITAKQASPKVQGKFTSGIGLIFTVIVGAGLFLVLGGGIGYLIARCRADRRRKERRKRKERRGSDRRQKDQPIEGEDKRVAKNRRADTPRRKEEDRRDERDRRDKP